MAIVNEAIVAGQAPRTAAPWLVPSMKTDQPPQGKARVFMFPYAGGGATVYRGWRNALAPELDAFAVQLPGRENRLREPSKTSVRAIVDMLVPLMRPHVERAPYSLFGHSLGALVAFEVAHALRDMGCPPPECLIVSGREGPRVPDFDPPLHGLPDAQFVREMSTRYDGIPQEILNEPDLLAMLLPAMRGDMSASETYEYGHKTRLSCPIVALGGTQDARVGMDELLAWGQETSGTFKTKLFAGGHFFLRPQQAAVMPFVKATIAEFSKKEARHGLLVDS